MRILATIFCLVILSACATLVNSDYTVVNVFTKQDSVKVYVNDSAKYTYTPARLIVERSREPLRLTLIQHDSIKNISVPRRLSPEFWAGNIYNQTLFLGFLVDLTNHRRFKYPSNVYYDFNDPEKVDMKYKPSETTPNLLSQDQQEKKFPGDKGMFNIKLSIPEGNFFVINKKTHIGNSFGFLGITTELDYYYKDKRYIGIGAGTLTDFIIPFPAAYDVEGEYERSFGTYFDILNGIDIRRFSFDYGFSVSKYQYYKRLTAELFPNYVDSLLYSKEETRIGLSFSSRFKIKNYFNVGLKYIPSFYTIDTNAFRYGHILFFDVAFNFEIRPKK